MEIVKTVKDEAADIGKQVRDLHEMITTAAAAESATRKVFDLTSQKGFKFEDVLHELINEEAVHFGDVAIQVGTELGLVGSKKGDETVILNPEDTRGAAVNVVWEAKTARESLRKILDELGNAMANRGLASASPYSAMPKSHLSRCPSPSTVTRRSWSWTKTSQTLVLSCWPTCGRAGSQGANWPTTPPHWISGGSKP